jgi:tRNA pseudouridine32 synthase / 23S rRNA pseudouridine746 synthase
VEKLVRIAQPDLGAARFVHQLDYATSGVLVVGLNKASTASACRAFETGSAKKLYVALLEGHIASNLTIEEPIGRFGPGFPQ